MTNEEAVKMLTARVECMERENSGTDHDCNERNCDECELCYTQGTMGEQREALYIAIEAMEKQIPMKPKPKELAVEQPFKNHTVYIRPCGNCGEGLNFLHPFCPWCGQKVGE